MLLQLFQLKLLCKAFRENGIQKRDLLHLPEYYDSNKMLVNLRTHWSSELEKSSSSLLRALCKTFGVTYALNCFLMVSWTYQ